MEEFSTVGFGYEKDNSIFMPVTKMDEEYAITKSYIESFEQIMLEVKLL